jgi:diaminohydroxyphosphoribosylaminopyrimidine deaminase/5-amino-6-(5-phosphoribosylamino)uracil reductase
MTWPNPSVGALVVGVPDGEPRIVGQGVTGFGGRPHAERQALAGAGEGAQGATLYVSLEPCAHHGKTPPCVDAIIPAGVARVVTALEDPDPRVSGRGHDRLRAAGVAVAVGVLADEARRSHRGHITRVGQGRPAMTLKLARTADGFASRIEGPRLMITGEAVNGRVHMMRAHADAILVGVGTVLADDPLLTVRLPGLEDRSPVRVVFDSRLRTPPSAQVVTGASKVPTWIVTAEHAPRDAEQPRQRVAREVVVATPDREEGLGDHVVDGVRPRSPGHVPPDGGVMPAEQRREQRLAIGSHALHDVRQRPNVMLAATARGAPA